MSGQAERMKTISRQSLTTRLVVLPVVLGLLLAMLSGPLAVHVFVFTGIAAVIIGNAVALARRATFTEAVEKMHPLSRIDDDTLFPEEIDPDMARPKFVRIINYIMAQSFLFFGSAYLASLLITGLKGLSGMTW